MQELITSCALSICCLDIQVLVVRDLLGDQRGEDLPPDLHQFVRGKVVLQHPFVRAALMTRPSRRAMPA